MRRIAHLSDLHFGRAEPAMVDSLRRDLEREAPDLVAISGDLTQRARRHEFAAARDFVLSLTPATVCAPGNHDMPAYDPIARFFRPRSLYREYIAENCRAYYVDDEIAVAAVDTTSRARLSLDWASGRIKRDDIAAVLSWIKAETRDHLTIVVAHHVLKTFAVGESLGHRLRHGALSALSAAGVDVMLGGHHHRSDAQIFSPADGMPNILVLHASTTTSNRVRGEANGYNLLELDGDQAICRMRAADDGRFAEVKVVAFRRNGSPGVWSAA
jgi:3',5'-cyclic AMP phosphodiesterase CpdA